MAGRNCRVCGGEGGIVDDVTGAWSYCRRCDGSGEQPGPRCNVTQGFHLYPHVDCPTVGDREPVGPVQWRQAL